jgi:hypothetical protein
MARTLLTLNTLVERDTIIINGTPYELRSPAELDLLEYHRVGTHAEALAALKGKADLDEADVAAVASALDEALRIFLLAPPAVLDSLSYVHKQAILRAFTAADAGITGAATAVTPPDSTGESASPA